MIRLRKNAEVTLFPSHAQKPADFQHWLGSLRGRFEDYLTKQGLNLTKQRETILRCLTEADQHLTAEQIYDQVKKKDASVGRATVFRTIKLLQECGLVDEIASLRGSAKFELKADRPHHDHMICVECGRILEFQSPMMEKFQDEAIRKQGFTALWHRHEIFGRCKLCQKQRS